MKVLKKGPWKQPWHLGYSQGQFTDQKTPHDHLESSLNITSEYTEQHGRRERTII